MNLNDFREAIRTDLSDPATLWSDNQLDRAVVRAIADLGRFIPNEAIRDYTLDFTVAGESFDSGTLDSWVSLDNSMLKPKSETVTSADGATNYTLGTDYKMDYATGKIQCVDGGDMVADTGYLIGYTKMKIGVDISDIAAGLIRVVDVEYPAGDIPVKRPAHKLWGNYLFIEAQGTSSQQQLSESQHIFVYYQKAYSDPTADVEENGDGEEGVASDYPDFLDELVIVGAEAYALMSRAAEMAHGAATMTNLESALTAASGYGTTAAAKLSGAEGTIDDVNLGKDVAENWSAQAEVYTRIGEVRVAEAIQRAAVINSYREAYDRFKGLGDLYMKEFFDMLAQRGQYRRDQSSVSVRQ